jgi:hypothetical protein
MTQRSRSGLNRSGQRKAKQAAKQAQSKQSPEMIPHVGQPLDGSQYIDVIEEQAWADRRPSPEEEKRRHTALDK